MNDAREPHPADFDLVSERLETHAFIQWKGTDVCMDFWCECGSAGHFDGHFAYVVKCPDCETLWEMPMILFPRKSQRPNEYGGVVSFEVDDD